MVLASAQERRHGSEQTGTGREGEGFGQPFGEGGRDQAREELPTGEVGGRPMRQLRQLGMAQQDLHGVVAQEGGEEAAHRGQVRHPRRHRRADSLHREAVVQR